MPFSNNSGGSNGGGPWGGDNKNRPENGNRSGPWGNGSGNKPNQGKPSPDKEELVRQSLERMKDIFGGDKKGGGGTGGGAPRGGGSWPSLGKFTLPVMLLGAVALYAYLTAYTVGAEQRAVVTRFGEALPGTSAPGLHFRMFPFPIDKVELVNYTSVRNITIGGGGRANSRTRSVADDEGMMLSSDKNLLDVEFTVFWNVNQADNFLFNVAEMEKTIRATAESAMREVVGRSEAEFVRSIGRSQVRDEVRNLAQGMLDEYQAGVNITNIQLNKVDPPTEVNDAFRAVEQAQQEKEQLINEATRDRNQLIARAEGERERLIAQATEESTRKVAEAEGEAARYGAIYQQYLQSPEIIRRRLYLETMERVLNADTLVIDPSLGVTPYLPLNQLNSTRRVGE